MASQAPSPPTTITIRSPSRYSSTTPDASTTPPLDWLHRTWTVTHSTLSMWRTARNVRITYTALPPRKSDGAPRLGDLVEYESASGSGGVKSVAGVDTAASTDSGTGIWDWRGKGWLFFVTSRWEVLGWGERPLPRGEGIERWVVTWFAPTLFTKEGVDVYSDRPEGGSEETVREILEALNGVEAKGVAEMCARDMRPVEIKVLAGQAR